MNELSLTIERIGKNKDLDFEDEFCEPKDDNLILKCRYSNNDGTCDRFVCYKLIIDIMDKCNSRLSKNRKGIFESGESKNWFFSKIFEIWRILNNIDTEIPNCKFCKYNEHYEDYEDECKFGYCPKPIINEINIFIKDFNNFSYEKLSILLNKLNNYIKE